MFVMVEIVQLNEASKGTYQLCFTWVSLEGEYLGSGRNKTLLSEGYNVIIIVIVVIIIIVIIIIIIIYYYYTKQNFWCKPFLCRN